MSPTRSWQRDINDAQPKIDPVQFVKEVFDGVVGDGPLTELETLDGACAAVERALMRKINRPLGQSEISRLKIDTASEFLSRRERQKQERTETLPLGSAFSVFFR